MRNKLLCLITLVLIGCASTDGPLVPVTEAEANKMPIKKLDAAIIKDPNNVYLHLARANYFAKNKSLDFAQEEYLIVLSMKPNDAGVELQYANFLCNRKYDLANASQFYVKALSGGDSTLYPIIYSDYADCLSATDNYDSARERYLKSLAYDNPPISAYIGIVNLYTTQKNYAMANYYAFLYTGPATTKSLEMQITALGNLLESDTNLENRSELKSKYSQLNTQYFKLTKKKFADIE